MKQFFAEEIEAENREGAEKNRPEFESGDGVANDGDGKSLQIDEESFAAEVGGIEEFEVAGFQSVQSIITVGSFIGIETGGDSFDVIDSDGEGESKNKDERNPCRDVVWTKRRWRVHKYFLFCVFYGRIVPEIT